MSRRSVARFVVVALFVFFQGQAQPSLSGSPLNRARMRFARAVGAWRPVEGRLVGDFAHAPLSAGGRPPGLAIALREAVADSPGAGAEKLAVAGIAELIDGRPDAAIPLLEKAATARPERADFLSDLAAAYLARAHSRRDPLALIQALDTAARAVAADPDLAAARFNFALALESLSLDGQARGAWKDFLRLESHTGWSAEARQRLGSLPQSGSAAALWKLAQGELAAAALRGDTPAVNKLAARNPQAAREYAEERLLGDWAREQLAGNALAAAKPFAIAKAIGGALLRLNGEPMVARTVKAIEEAAADPGGGARLKRLANGHSLYQDGLRRIEDGRIPEAMASFARARELLKAGGSPFAAWAAFRVAVCEVLHFQYDQALQSIHTLQASPEGQAFRSLSARSYWIAGLIHGIQARPTESIAAYRKSARIFSALGEVENAANANARLGESLEVFGDLEGAWSHYALALRSLRALREPVRREFILEGGSLTALRMGRPRAALALQQEAAGVLAESADPAAWVYCLRRRALIEIHAGLREEARHDLAAARSWLAKIPDPVLRSSLVGDILVVEAQAGGFGDARDAVAKLSEVVKIYRETGSQALLAVFLARRGRAQAGLGRLDLAEADYREAIAAISRQHDAIQERDLQDWFLAGARSVFEGMVRLQAERGDAWRALSYAERGRAQLFREQTSGETLTPESLGAEEIARRIPSGTALVEFLVTDRELLAWVVRRGSVELVRTPIVPAVLGRQVEQLRREIQEGTGSSQSARSLFEILLGKLRPLLQGAGTLVLVPDGDLYQIPFAALRDDSGRYLIEDHALIVSPSASLYVQALAAERKRSRRTWDRAMVLGAGRRGPRSARSLRPCPGRSAPGSRARRRCRSARATASAR